ncbi:hypothetical protein OTU49_010872, partial [Cherax quadricarinatus]
FRWNYLEEQDSSALPGFTKFLQGGGRAKFTNPLFPTLSYPTWTTLSTGQYAETHGIVGNYFYDPQTEEVFSLFDKESTGKQKVYEQVSKIPGVTAYKHSDIPERFHYKNNKYIHDIILLADQGHFIMASKSEKQLPLRNNYVYIGAHGYDPDLQDMKGIFFAKGPAFKCGWTIDPIHIVDIYQVLSHVLGVAPQPHNGTWERVREIFTSDGSHTLYTAPSHTSPLQISFLLSSVVLIMFCVTYYK